MMCMVCCYDDHVSGSPVVPPSAGVSMEAGLASRKACRAAGGALAGWRESAINSRKLTLSLDMGGKACSQHDA
jgi:hypothetical protein